MIFSHFSSTADVIRPYSVEQNREPHCTPLGFWVIVDGDDDWPEGTAGDYGIGSFRHRVELADGPLVLGSVEAIRAFSVEYGVSYLDRQGGSTGYEHVDWLSVANFWPGIIIAPCQRELRNDALTPWYSPWGWASGYIWDASVIMSVERVTPESGEIVRA